MLTGEAGIDTVSYSDSATGVTIDLAVGTGLGGTAQGGTLLGIEDVNGSSLADTLVGNVGANVLRGLDGGDPLRGGAGPHTLDGGAGIDTVSYYESSVGVVVSLATGIGSGGNSHGDTLLGIENVSGSQGDDVLVGGAGKDTLTGGAGADQFRFTALGDSVVGANADRITDFSHAQADRIDLHLIDANTGVAGDQAFSFIGTGAYTSIAGQLRYVVRDGVTTTNRHRAAKFMHYHRIS